MLDGLNYLQHANITELAKVIHEDRIARFQALRLQREAIKAGQDVRGGRKAAASGLQFHLRSFLRRVAPRLASRMLL